MIENSIIHIEEGILDKYGIEAIYLFGSSLRAGFLSEDIDLALLFKNNRNIEEYFNLTAMFELYLLGKYGKAKKFDLSILNLASSLLKYEVVTFGKPIYFKDINNLAIFELKVRQEYADYSYRSRLYDEVLIERISRR